MVHVHRHVNKSKLDKQSANTAVKNTCPEPKQEANKIDAKEILHTVATARYLKECQRSAIEGQKAGRRVLGPKRIRLVS